MKAPVLEGIQKLALRDVPDAQPGVRISVKASGVCRSDWHAWIGDIPRTVPMIIGHETAGIAEEVMPGVKRSKKGERHLQIGLTTRHEAGCIKLPVDLMVRNGLKLIGPVGMSPHRYASMLPLIVGKKRTPGKMVNREISLALIAHGRQ